MSWPVLISILLVAALAGYVLRHLPAAIEQLKRELRR